MTLNQCQHLSQTVIVLLNHIPVGLAVRTTLLRLEYCERFIIGLVFLKYTLLFQVLEQVILTFLYLFD